MLCKKVSGFERQSIITHLCMQVILVSAVPRNTVDVSVDRHFDLLIGGLFLNIKFYESRSEHKEPKPFSGLHSPGEQYTLKHINMM